MSAMMISSIRLDKQPPAPAVARVESAHRRQPMAENTTVATRRQMLAPLASLDCSITEPITDTHTSTTDTPTLSGYFDCDQLSDMVDDSLFEITNTGCLSKSIFDGRARASPIDEAAGGRTEQEEEEDEVRNKQDEEEDELESGSCTPTNEQPMSMRPLEVTAPTSILGQSQAAMMADHQAYDYSSTSTIPARWTQGNSSSNGHRQRSKSARFSQVSSGPKSSTNGEPQITGESSSKIIHKSRRKTRSTPDVRTEAQVGENGLCSECQQERLEGGPVKKKKERKRFTFSLFNLFSSSSSSSSGTSDNQTTFDKKSKTGESCNHRKPSNDGDRNVDRNTLLSNGDRPKATTGTTSRRRASKSNVPATGTGIRSRDSIRLMNQKKRAVRGSQTYSDFQTAPDTSTELLLDLKRRPVNHQDHEYATFKLRPSQSSYTVQEDRLVVENNTSSGSQRSQTRPTKSVKFTMHDKVMIVPPESGARIPAQPPPAYLQPTAPIIKRSVPKSSSYSQTETNKNLEDLLAKYEVNTDLIAELNERLKLTETIASPISTLDQALNIDTHQEHSIMTSNNNISLENRDCQIINGLRESENNMVGVETVESSCDDDPSSNQTSGSSSKNENGGFSSEWVDKQQRGLT